MKKLITIMCLVLGIGLIISPIANAEEVVEDTTTENTTEDAPVVEDIPSIDEVIDEEFITTEIGEKFKEEIAPVLINAGISLIGFIVSVLILWLKNKGSILNLNKDISTAVEKNQEDISSKLAITNEINAQTQREIKEFKNIVLSENEALKNEIAMLKEQNNKLYIDNQKIQEINSDLVALKHSFKVIVCNDPKLVENGQAKLLAKELETNGEQEGI